MAEVTIRPATPEDAEALFAALRPADLRECLAYGQADVRAGIAESIAGSFFCWSAHEDTALLAVFGVGPLSMINGIGSPWLLGTPLLDRRSRLLQRLAPQYVAKMLQFFPHLLNFVHVENVRSVRWLKRLGFTIHPPAPYGRLGHLFHRFEMHRHV